MKFPRLFSALGFMLGLSWLVMQSGPTFQVLPFPGEGLKVRTTAKINFADDFDLKICIPTSDDTQESSINNEPVELLIKIDNGKSSVSKQISSISLFNIYTFGKVMYYHSTQSWRLGRGNYVFDISCIKNSRMVMMRGATITIDHPPYHPTERLIQHDLLLLCGALLMIASLLGFIIGTRKSKLD